MVRCVLMNAHSGSARSWTQKMLVPANEDCVPPDVIDQNWLWLEFGGELLDADMRRLPARARWSEPARDGSRGRSGCWGSYFSGPVRTGTPGLGLGTTAWIGWSLSTAAATATGVDEGARRRTRADSRPRSRTRTDVAGRSAQSL